MKAREKEEKDKIKLRYAVGLARALANSKYNSFRDLALQSGLEPAHIQRISVGKVDVALTTCISLAEGLGISYTELSTYYDKVTDKDIQDFLQAMEARKKKGKGGTKNSVGSKTSLAKNRIRKGKNNKK